MLAKLADDIKLGGEVHTSKERAILHKNLERLEESASKNRVKFDKGKCRFLYLL